MRGRFHGAGPFKELVNPSDNAAGGRAAAAPHSNLKPCPGTDLRAENEATQAKWAARFGPGRKRCARLFSALAGNTLSLRSVDLRALFNRSPRTRQAPEGATVP